MRNSRQQTVHVAVTRRMAPSAHILAYFIDYTGELVADVIHFHVSITSDTVVLNLTLNQRKDLTGDTVELLAYGPPQARVAFAGTEYAQYQLYGGNDLLEMDVCNQNLIILRVRVTYRIAKFLFIECLLNKCLFDIQ